MFEIGFWEIVLVSLVALLVFGPERLPGLVREVMAVIRQVRGVATSARDQLNRELEIQELRQTLQEQKRLLTDTLKDPDNRDKVHEEGKREETE